MAVTSLEQLERDAEQTRAEFSGTVDELKNRISGTADDLRRRASPESLKSDVKQYIDRTSQDILHSLKRKAAERPLEALALGGCLAYVGWRAFRNIPAPILLLGAGVALLRSSSHVGTPSGGSTDAFSQNPGAAFEKVRTAVSEGAATVTAGVMNTVSDTAQAARKMASSATAAVSDAASSMYQGGTDTALRAGNQASQAVSRSQEYVANALVQHPMVVGGVGLAIGAAIAASLPSTAVEGRLLGEKSADLKDRATKMGSEGYEAAKSAGQRIYDRSFGQSGTQSSVSEASQLEADDTTSAAMQTAAGVGKDNGQSNS